MGHDLIHRVGRALTVGGLLTYIALAVAIMAKGLPAGFMSFGPVKASGLLAMISVAAVWQITLAPYVSDYSRYMPKNAAALRSTFWMTYWGCVLGAILPMLIGAAVAALAKGGTIASIQPVSGSLLGGIALVLLGVVTLHINSMNLYGSSLTLSTAVQTFRHDWLPSKAQRGLFIFAVGALSVILAVALTNSFNTAYNDFLTLMLYLLAPWSVINLVDYYLVKRGEYDVQSFFAPGGGVYGWFNWKAIIAYLIGVGVQIPFVSTTLYTGPLYHDVGADISWMVCIVVAIPVYLALVRLGGRPGPTPSEGALPTPPTAASTPSALKH